MFGSVSYGSQGFHVIGESTIHENPFDFQESWELGDGWIIKPKVR